MEAVRPTKSVALSDRSPRSNGIRKAGNQEQSEDAIAPLKLQRDLRSLRWLLFRNCWQRAASRPHRSMANLRTEANEADEDFSGASTRQLRVRANPVPAFLASSSTGSFNHEIYETHEKSKPVNGRVGIGAQLRSPFPFRVFSSISWLVQRTDRLNGRVFAWCREKQQAMLRMIASRSGWRVLTARAI